MPPPITMPSNTRIDNPLKETRALDIAQRTHAYLEAFHDGTLPPPEGGTKQAVERLMAEPDTYRQRLVMFALGFEVEGKDGERIERKNMTLERLMGANTRFRDVRLPHYDVSFVFVPAEEVYNKLVGSRGVDDTERHIDSVLFDEGHGVDKLFNLDYQVLERMLPVHLRHLDSLDPGEQLRLADVPVDQKADAATLRQMVLDVMGVEKPDYHGRQFGMNDSVITILPARVVQNETGLPFLAYGLQDTHTDELLTDYLIQDPRQGGVAVAEAVDIPSLSTLPASRDMQGAITALKRRYEPIIKDEPALAQPDDGRRPGVPGP